MMDFEGKVVAKASSINQTLKQVIRYFKRDLFTHIQNLFADS